MKKNAFFTIVIFCTSFVISVAQAQKKFPVLFAINKVNGVVKNEKNVQLRTGQRIKITDKLVFHRSTDYVALTGTDRRPYILQPRTLKNLVPVETVIKAGIQNKNKRTGGISNVLAMKTFFRDTSDRNEQLPDSVFVILGDELKIKVLKDVYPMNQNNFFYIRLYMKNDMANKKLAFRNDTLIINKHDLLLIDNKPIAYDDVHKFKLYYYRQNVKSLNLSESELGVEFWPLFLDTDSLRNELLPTIELGREHNATKDELYEAAGSYINQYYGNPVDDQLIEWLRQEFGIEP